MHNFVRNGAGPWSGAAACLIFIAALLLAPQPAASQAVPALVHDALEDEPGANRDVRAFYRARGHRPIWIGGRRLRPEAGLALRLIETAALDGLDPDDYRPRAIAEAIAEARGGSPEALARAEMMLSRWFADYMIDMRRRPRRPAMIYAERDLARERPPRARDLLEEAAAAPSLRGWLEEVGWMHPFYGPLRAALAAGRPVEQQRLLRLNMERLRALPAGGDGRYILVDAAGARLWMFENGRAAGSMRVVVGRVNDQTPMIAGRVRYAVVNPYWNVPPDLVPSRIAPNVLSHGADWLRGRGYQVLSDWTDAARPIPPETIDWRVAAAGGSELRIRQLPGPANAMGRIKFLFPNEHGVYLHDTPERDLLREASRQFSAGCVRVEDAQRLARWLFGRALDAPNGAVEHYVPLPEPVPVYITYLTAAPEGERIAFRRDVYGRDGGGGTARARR